MASPHHVDFSRATLHATLPSCDTVALKVDGHSVDDQTSSVDDYGTNVATGKSHHKLMVRSLSHGGTGSSGISRYVNGG